MQHLRRTRYPLSLACSLQFADRNDCISASVLEGGVNPEASNLPEASSVV